MPDALTLLDRARNGELRLHIPAICLLEARGRLRGKYQIRPEADRVRRYLKWAKAQGIIAEDDDSTVRRTLEGMENRMNADLRDLSSKLDSLKREPNLDVFPMDQEMLEKALQLTSEDLALKPFDLSILSAVLARAAQLGRDGLADLAFCALNSDLQPWDKTRQPKKALKELYDRARVWIFGDYVMQTPPRPKGWPA